MEKQINNITLGKVLSWTFGIIFLISGIFTLFSNFIVGVLLILISILILPIFYSLLISKTKISLSRNLRILIVVILIVLAGLLTSENETKVTTKIEDSSIKQKTEEIQTKDNPIEKDITKEPTKQIESKIEPVPLESKPKLVPQVEVTSQPTPTLGERQALSSAKSYLNYTGFSRKGLIEQLEYEGFTREEAEYGVDNSNANWNEQAAKSAKNYIEYTSFSRSGLIEQLVYEGYTKQQAEYGVQTIGY